MTMIPFLPPSSRWTCLSWSAAFFVEHARLARAREGDHRDVEVAHEPVARLLAVAVDEVDDPVREPRFAEQLDEARRQERRVLGRLSTTVLPRTERGRELPRGDRDREVPRRDRADDADRHPDRHLELVAELGGRRVAEHAPALAGHVDRRVDRFCTSPPASASTLPISRLISSVSSSLRSSTCARSGAGSCRAPARERAATPRTRLSPPRRRGRRPRQSKRGNEPSDSPVAGTRDSNISPDAPSSSLAADEVLARLRGDCHAAECTEAALSSRCGSSGSRPESSRSPPSAL